jgi:hypothetical protein
MVKKITSKAKSAFAWLLNIVRYRTWNLSATRLVLLDVYMRSVLTFGVVIWGAHFSLDSK